MGNIFIDKRTNEKVNVDDETAVLYLKNPAIFDIVEDEQSKSSEPINDATTEVVETEEEDVKEDKKEEKKVTKKAKK